MGLDLWTFDHGLTDATLELNHIALLDPMGLQLVVVCKRLTCLSAASDLAYELGATRLPVLTAYLILEDG